MSPVCFVDPEHGIKHASPFHIYSGCFLGLVALFGLRSREFHHQDQPIVAAASTNAATVAIQTSLRTCNFEP